MASSALDAYLRSLMELQQNQGRFSTAAYGSYAALCGDEDYAPSREKQPNPSEESLLVLLTEDAQ